MLYRFSSNILGCAGYENVLLSAFSDYSEFYFYLDNKMAGWREVCRPPGCILTRGSSTVVIDEAPAKLSSRLPFSTDRGDLATFERCFIFIGW